MERRYLTADEKEENVILEFRPRPQQDMLIACLWSRWSDGGEPELLSFAAITDDPPAKVAAAGLDRCIIPIKPENVDAWLNPDPSNLAAQYAILDDRERPYYEHRLIPAFDNATLTEAREKAVIWLQTCTAVLVLSGRSFNEMNPW